MCRGVCFFLFVLFCRDGNDFTRNSTIRIFRFDNKATCRQLLDEGTSLCLHISSAVSVLPCTMLLITSKSSAVSVLPCTMLLMASSVLALEFRQQLLIGGMSSLCGLRVHLCDECRQTLQTHTHICLTQHTLIYV